MVESKSAVLFCWLGSGVVVVTVAVLVTALGVAFGLTVPFTVMTAWVMMRCTVPRSQLKAAPVMVQVPWVANAWVGVSPGGRVSLTTTFWASEGPLSLSTVIV